LWEEPPLAATGEDEEAGEDEDTDTDPPAGGPRRKQADILLELASSVALFHTPDKEGYVEILVGNHRENWPIRSRGFKDWLRYEYFKQTQSGCTSDAMQIAIETIDARAKFEGAEEEVHCRVAEHDGAIYIDIGDATWRGIKVTKTGWEIVTEPPVRFRRSASMRALPIPRPGGKIELLRPFCNVSDDGFILLVADALAVLRPNASYPIFTITGEHGACKTTLARIIRRLTDPRVPEERSLPRAEDDLVTAAKGSHLLSFDNISGLPDWLSDAFCRLATGGGAGKRRLYTDDDEILFAGRRPICLNGIEDVATRPDLVDRIVMLTLDPVRKRHTEEKFNRAFERRAPKMFGALLDGLAAGLQNLASVTMPDKPRMADFALWAEACTRAYWPAGTFLKAYQANLAASVELVLESSPVGDAVRRFMVGRSKWEGTASELLPLLTALVDEQIVRDRSYGWPKRPNALSGKLKRVAPALRKIGIHVARDRASSHDRTKAIHITTRSEPKPGGGPDYTGKTSSTSSTSSTDKDINDLGRTITNGASSTPSSAASGGDGADDHADDGEPEIVRRNPLITRGMGGVDDVDDLLHAPSGEQDRRRICAHCHLNPPDGKEQRCSIAGEELWLHPECQRFYEQEKEGLSW
jgi:hypothetical protein